jgi:transcription elongation factor GreB
VTDHFITPEGLARIRAEYEELFGIERPKVVETVSWAASLGDRSENADYIYGKRRLREIDRRLGTWRRS